MVNPALQELYEKYTAENDGHLGYRQFVAIARIHLALKELAADHGIDWQDVLDKSESIPGWRNKQEEIDFPPKQSG